MDGSARNTNWSASNQWKIGPNTAEALANNGAGGFTLPNTWTLHKLHINPFGANRGVEMWQRPKGTLTWTKTMDWRVGLTPYFQWTPGSISTGGMRWLQFPSILQTPNTWQYLADYAIATSEANLPTYGAY
jgi:hypothetical protein